MRTFYGIVADASRRWAGRAKPRAGASGLPLCVGAHTSQPQRLLQAQQKLRQGRVEPLGGRGRSETQIASEPSK